MAGKRTSEDFDWKSFTPEDSPKTPMDVMADPKHKDLATAKLGVGDEAVNFELPVLDFSTGIRKVTDRVFNLLTVSREKPVALIFGSYT